MKKLLLATVFGGLLIAAPAMADDDTLGVAVAISAQGGNVEDNDVESDYGSIYAEDENEVEDRAFQNAIGIFHVQQNTGANSLVQASTAVAAILNCGCDGDDIANISVAVSLQRGNVEDNDLDSDSSLYLDSDNEIKDRAFQNATGIFQVQQNTGSNALLQSGVSVALISGQSSPE